MKFLRFTRPDGSDVYINAEAVESFAPSLRGDATTRIRQQTGDQYVKETAGIVAQMLGIEAD